MVAVTLRAAEACERQPQLAWDTIWIERLDASGGYGDWILAGPADQPESRGGLRAEQALHTASLILLFTDARAAEDDKLPDDDGDRRGWWGDSVRLDGEPEAPMGSKIWLYARSPLTEPVRAGIEDAARDALAVLVTQGAVARTDVSAEIDRVRSAVLLTVRHYSHDGTLAYDQRFGVLWAQVPRNAPMNFGERSFA